MVAPADGYIINLQVQPGMVAGIIWYGAIATFIVDADRYVLATYTQEQLKYVKESQNVEIAFNLYPGKIFQGKVKDIWQGSGSGQMVPSGQLPTFNPQDWNSRLLMVELALSDGFLKTIPHSATASTRHSLPHPSMIARGRRLV